MVNQVLEISHPPASPAPCLRVFVAAPPSILGRLFQVPYPATPLFATLAKTTGVHPKFSVWERAPFHSWSASLAPEEKRGRSDAAPQRGFRNYDLIWLEAASQVTAALRK